MVSCCHELGEGRIAKNGIVWEADVGDVEVNEFGVVVVTLAEGEREANLPYGNGGAISHP